MSSVAEQAKANALMAMKLTRKLFVVELDFSEDSIVQLESLMDDVAFSVPGGMSDENVDQLSRLWGQYVGQVMVQSFSGQWLESSQDPDEPELLVRDRAFFPCQAVRRRLRSGSEASIWNFYQSAQDAPAE